MPPPAESSESSKPHEPPTATDVTRSFSQLLWKIQEIESTLSSFDPAVHADILEQRLLHYQKLLQDAREMAKQRHKPGTDDSPEQNANLLEGRKLPETLLRALDDGENPDTFLRNTFIACKRDNQLSKGKCEALQGLAAALLEDAAAFCPKEAAEYRRLISGQR